MSDLFSNNSLFSQSKEEKPDTFSDFLKNVELEDEDTTQNIENVYESPSFPEYKEPNHISYQLADDFLDAMNEEQKEAVLYDQGSLLILAGAGSGKTRVITHRFAYLVHKYQLNINNILCVTFTNKAAGEMKERIGDLLGVSPHRAWIRTFHSMCVMILREYAPRIGFTSDFTIYDSSDTKNAIKKIMERLNIDPQVTADKAIIKAISSAKEELIRPEEMEKNARTSFDYVCAEVYKEYHNILKQNQAMDFGDLILNTITILENCPDVQERYHRQWRFIMTDEFQDTNDPQYRLLTLLTRDKNNVCVVGDDDQSIYGWRGARVENIQKFHKEFGAHIIRLEKNYRSHGTILEAANSIVKSIKGRMPKKLKAVRDQGGKIIVSSLGDDRLQASYIYDEIKKMMTESQKDYRDFAVLYRTNAQSRILEEVFTRHRVPYKIWGGQRFFDRAEIKDILSYLRIIVNPNDGEAFDRIVNIPKRKIGDATKEKINEYLALTKESFPQACLNASQINGIGKSTIQALENLGKIITELKESINTISPTEIIKLLIESIAYLDQYLIPKYGIHEAEDRFANIQELVNAVRAFEESNPDSTIADFLREASLLSSLNEEEGEKENVVSLMTIHSAKGLEFPIVFIIGVTEGILPLSNSFNSHEIDEEKRLFYVAITRAMDKLYLSYEQRSLRYGEYVYNEKSHFLDMIPSELLAYKKSETEFSSQNTYHGSKYNRGQQSYSHKQTTKKVQTSYIKPDLANIKTEKINSMDDISMGQNVLHGVFGKGSVEYISEAMIKVKFTDFGTQVLMGASILNLKKIIE